MGIAWWLFSLPLSLLKVLSSVQTSEVTLLGSSMESTTTYRTLSLLTMLLVLLTNSHQNPCVKIEWTLLIFISPLMQGWEEEAKCEMFEIWCKRGMPGSFDCKPGHQKRGEAILRLQWIRKWIPYGALRLSFWKSMVDRSCENSECSLQEVLILYKLVPTYSFCPYLFFVMFYILVPAVITFYGYLNEDEGIL